MGVPDLPEALPLFLRRLDDPLRGGVETGRPVVRRADFRGVYPTIQSVGGVDDAGNDYRPGEGRGRAAARGIQAVPGNIFSIEPGVYLENDMGVRVEDLVLVTDHGHEILNHFSKELTVID